MIKLKLYELKNVAAWYFCRISKSTITNIKAIYSLERSFSGTAVFAFYDTHLSKCMCLGTLPIYKEKLSEMSDIMRKTLFRWGFGDSHLELLLQRKFWYSLIDFNFGQCLFVLGFAYFAIENFGEEIYLAGLF